MNIAVDIAAYAAADSVHLQLLCVDKTTSLGPEAPEFGRTVELSHTSQDRLLRWLWPLAL